MRSFSEPLPSLGLGDLASGSHAPAWEQGGDAPASRIQRQAEAREGMVRGGRPRAVGLGRGWARWFCHATLERRDCAPTPERGSQSEELYTYEETKQMPYVTSAERFGIEKGYRQGEANLLLWQIEKKFGETSAVALRERVASADSDTLRLWSERILTADTPDALFQ